MAKSLHSINLLPGKGDTLLVQFLNWMLTIGRLLIILVETLALGTFLYRFSLDMNIADLKDKIKNQRAIVANYKSQEDTFRDLQARLEILKKLENNSDNSSKILSDIIGMGKGYITFKNIYVSDSLIRIEAQAGSTALLTAFVNSLKKYDRIMNISIDKVENKTSSAEIIIGISAYIKQIGKPVDDLMAQPTTAPIDKL